VRASDKKEAIFVGLLFWRGGSRKVKNTLCQICANLTGTSWYLVAQHATSVTA